LNYSLEISEVANEHLKKHAKSGNKKILTKIKILLLELKKHPESGTRKPERLKYEFSGL